MNSTEVNRESSQLKTVTQKDQSSVIQLPICFNTSPPPLSTAQTKPIIGLDTAGLQPQAAFFFPPIKLQVQSEAISTGARRNMPLLLLRVAGSHTTRGRFPNPDTLAGTLNPSPRSRDARRPSTSSAMKPRAASLRRLWRNSNRASRPERLATRRRLLEAHSIQGGETETTTTPAPRPLRNTPPIRSWPGSEYFLARATGFRPLPPFASPGRKEGGTSPPPGLYLTRQRGLGCGQSAGSL